MEIYTPKNSSDLRSLLRLHKRLPDMRLGGILLEEGLINEDQLYVALRSQQNSKGGGRHLGQLLMEAGLSTPNS